MVGRERGGRIGFVSLNHILETGILHMWNFAGLLRSIVIVKKNVFVKLNVVFVMDHEAV